MPAPRPARGQKSPSIQAFQSKAARRGPAPGIKFFSTAGTARAGGHSAGGLGRGAAGRGWSCNRRSGPRSRSPPAGRFARKPAQAAARRSSRPTIETSARLPGANTGAKRGSAIRASTLPPAPRARRRSSRRRCGRDIAARRRGGDRGDIGQRLQQPVHQRAALQRVGAQLDRFAGPHRMASSAADRTGAAGFRRMLPTALMSAARMAARSALSWPPRRSRGRGEHPPAASSASPGQGRSRSPEAAARTCRDPW